MVLQKDPVVDLLRSNSRRDTETAILTPKGYNKQALSF